MKNKVIITKKDFDKIITMMKQGVETELCIALLLSYMEDGPRMEKALKLKEFAHLWARQWWGHQSIDEAESKLECAEREAEMYAKMLVDERGKHQRTKDEMMKEFECQESELREFIATQDVKTQRMEKALIERGVDIGILLQ